jgi:hypothetical protein
MDTASNQQQENFSFYSTGEKREVEEEAVCFQGFFFFLLKDSINIEAVINAQGVGG